MLRGARSKLKSWSEQPALLAVDVALRTLLVLLLLLFLSGLGAEDVVYVAF